jgi:hypothetical protein
MLQLLLPFQRLFIPGLILLLVWSSYRTIFKKDRAVGLVLYLGLLIIVDGFLNTGIYIPGQEYGSIKYSEVCALFLILNNPKVYKSEGIMKWIIVFLFVYFLLFFYSALRGLTVENGLQNFRRIIIPQITAFIVSYRGFEKQEDYNRFLLYFMVLIIIIGLFTFWDVFFDRWIIYSDTLRTKTYWSGRRNNRFGSFFLNPNYMGAFSVLVFPVLFMRALQEKTKLRKIYCWTGVLAIIFALIETQSRGPLLGFLGSVLFFILVPTKNYSIFKKSVYILIFLVVFSLFMPGFFKHATGRFDTIDREMDDESRSRRTVWEYTLNIIGNYPFFGIGLGEGQFIRFMYQAGFRDEFLARPLDNAHNSYLQIAVHAGVPAFIIFVSCNLILITKGITLNMRKSIDTLSLYVAGLITGIFGYLISLVPGIHMFTPSVAPCYWLIFGITFSLVNFESRITRT